MRSTRASAGVVFLFVFLFAIAFVVPLSGAEASLKAEDLLVKHLDGVGPAEARAAAKTRVVQGAAVYRILVGGGGRKAKPGWSARTTDFALW